MAWSSIDFVVGSNFVSECSHSVYVLTLNETELNLQTELFFIKFSKQRYCPFGAFTAVAFGTDVGVRCLRPCGY